MPLFHFHAVAGKRSSSALRHILDVSHEIAVSAFQIPPRDRYQVLHEHPAGYLVMEDTGLGFDRTDDRILIQVITRPRPQQQKTTFYKTLAEALRKECDLQPNDLMIAVLENTDSDWSFGSGEAQFLTGAL